MNYRFSKQAAKTRCKYNEKKMEDARGRGIFFSLEVVQVGGLRLEVGGLRFEVGGAR